MPTPTTKTLLAATGGIAAAVGSALCCAGPLVAVALGLSGAGLAGTFEPLRFIPADKIVVLGLVSSKEGKLESQDDLLRRIDEAARYVPIERLALSSQCGFASMAAGNLLTQEEQWRKLKLVAETARKVWG